MNPRRIAPGSALAILAAALAGCPATPGLPDSFEVATSATAKQAAARGSGPASLANSSWAAFRKFDPNNPDEPPADPAPGPYGGLLDGGLLARPPVDAQIFIVDFGEGGAISRIRENAYFLADIYGTEIVIGPAWVPASIPGMTFRSATFGVQVGQRFGVAIVAQVQALGVYVGRAVIYAWGTLDGDRFDGTFGYLLDFEGGSGDALLDSGGDQYLVYALRQ